MNNTTDTLPGYTPPDVPAPPKNADEAYERWKASPTPENMSGMLHTLRPVVRGALARAGVAGDKNVEMEMLANLADSITTKYDPSKAKLHSFAYNVMLRTPRVVSRQRQPVHIPESADALRRKIIATEKELTEKLDREPTVSEVADTLGVSQSRIEEIKRRYGRSIVTESFHVDNGADIPGIPNGDTDSMSHIRDMWVRYTVEALDPIDRKIYEWTHQDNPLSKTEIARKLNMSVAAISSRSAKIQGKLNELG